MSAYVDIDLPPGAVPIRTSGVCSVCDCPFRDEMAYEVHAPDVRGGVTFVEARHVHIPRTDPPRSVWHSADLGP